MTTRLEAINITLKREVHVEYVWMNKKKLKSLDYERALTQSDIEDLLIISEQLHKEHSNKQ